MNYLVDGYNLFFRTQEHTHDFEKDIENFFHNLHGLCANSSAQVTMILDSSEGHLLDYASLKSNKGLTVLLSPEKMSADAFIIEQLNSLKPVSNWCIVSDDKEIIQHSHYENFATCSTKAFMKIISKRRKSSTKRENPLPSDVNAFLEEEFKRRLRNDLKDLD